MAINPCTSLNERLEQQVDALEDIRDFGVEKLDEARQQFEDFSESPTDPNDLANSLLDMTDDALGAGEEDIAQISNFAGSCLDDVTNKADEFKDRIFDAIGGLFNDVPSLNNLAERALAQAMSYIKGLLEGFKISDMLNEIDRMLSCLSDQSDLAECLSELQDKSDRINQVLDDLNLSSDGIFEESSFFDSISGMAESLKNNITAITDKMESVQDSVLENIETMKQSIAGVMPSEDLF